MAINAIVGLLLILGLCAFVYGPWQWICTDIARQILFEKRDAIFDMARAEKLSFKDPEYRTIRRSLEKAIRYSHELTLPKFLCVLVAHKIYEDTKQPELFMAIRRIENPRVREEIEAHVAEALRALALMMLVKSPLTILILLPVAIVRNRIPAMFRWTNHKATQVKELIQSEAEEADNLRMAA